MPLVTVIIGSESDQSIVANIIDILRNFKIPYELGIASAHRNPERLVEMVKRAEENGTCVFIAAAGMAAHLAGAVAANTTKPVIGVPVGSGPLKGIDSLLSTVMMPGGVPVATVAIDGGKNAALLALEILALLPDGKHLQSELEQYRIETENQIAEAERTWLKDIENS